MEELEIARASQPYFTNEDMVRILELDSDYISDDDHAKKLESLSMSASQFLMDKTNFDWSSLGDRHPTADDCAELFVKQRWYENTDYSESHDYSLGISADIYTLINILRKARAKAGVNNV